MTRWHDDMMHCTNAKMNATDKTNYPTKLGKPRKASEAPVLGRYNTPPLREDLVLRSRMAPEGNGRGREKVKLIASLTNE